MRRTETDCAAEWCAGDEWCAVTCTAHLLGRKWHPVIVHRLLDDPKGFSELEDEIGEVSSAVLSDSLDDLEEKGLVERAIVTEEPFRVEYSLTEQGASLRPVVRAMDEWGTSYLDGASGDAEARSGQCD